MEYIEYVICKKKYNISKSKLNDLLDDYEKMFSAVLPSATDYSVDKVDTSPRNDKIDSFIAMVNEKGIEESIKSAKVLVENRERLLEAQKRRLYDSKDLRDIIYRRTYLERNRAEKIAREGHYSKSQIYRIISKIEKTIAMIDESE